MTLREVIAESGATVSFPKELENIECRKEDLSNELLFNYFNTSNFSNDILSIMEKIHTAKEKGYENFSLFFVTDPVELRVFTLNF